MIVRNKIVFIIVFLVGIVLAQGCETTKSVVTGVATGITTGIPKDIKDTYHSVKKADTWMKENLW